MEHDDIARLDVTMDDVFEVKGLERRQNLLREANKAILAEGHVGILHDHVEAAALEMLHDQPENVISCRDIEREKPHDVLVIQSAQNRCLPF